jgi:hypothetical protein
VAQKLILIAVIMAEYHNDKLIYTTKPGIRNVVVSKLVPIAGFWSLIIDGINATLKAAKLIAKTMSCQSFTCIKIYYLKIPVNDIL